MNDKKEIVAELTKTISEANQGNWIPLTVIIAFLVIIFSLLLVLLKNKYSDIDKNIKSTDNKVSEHKDWLIKLTDISNEQKVIIKELQTMTAYHEKDIEKLKQA